MLAARALFTSSIAGALALVSCTRGEVDRTRSSITMGAPSDAHPAVIAIVRAGEDREVECTGTLLTPRVVLTAAHCAIDVTPQDFEVFAGDALATGGERVAVIAARRHPDYASASPDADLALLLLAEPLDRVPIVGFSGPTLDAQAVIVGYGRTAGSADDANRKRQGTARVSAIEGGHIVLAGDPSLPCGGDSGGPVFDASGERLVAVISRGDADCASASRAARLDVHEAAFVSPTLEAWADGVVSLGAPCLFDAHCESALCVAAIDEPRLRYCAVACDAASGCDAPLVCDASREECRHPLPTPGALGASCVDDDACPLGECVRERSVCGVRCVAGRDVCPGATVCTRTASIDFFCVAPPPPSCACGVPKRNEERAWWPLLVSLVFVALAARPRRTSP